MAQVTVTIAGRAYRMACGNGEEAHLEGLARLFDEKIDEMRGAFGEIGDMRLHVMAAITLADELAEMKGRLARMEAEVAELRAQSDSHAEHVDAQQAHAAEAVARAVERVERITRALSVKAE